MPMLTSYGKERIFFSNNDADREWRLTEKLVAVSELLLKKDDVYAFSSTRIPNIVGDLTELDVVFSNTANPTDAFEFIQVRDRQGTQGRPWLEQVIGQKTTLGIANCCIVSTEQFAQTVIRLAQHENIPARLLLPDDNSSAQRWYSSDHIEVKPSDPIIDLVECNILVRRGDRMLTLKAEREQCIERNILPHSNEPDKFFDPVTSLMVLNKELRHRPELASQVLDQIPNDNLFHIAPPIVIQYTAPQLSIEFIDENGLSQILNVIGIIFLKKVNKQTLQAPVTMRRKYIDAVNGIAIAEIIVGEIKIDDRLYYACLMRHSCEGEQCLIGGAYFS